MEQQRFLIRNFDDNDKVIKAAAPKKKGKAAAAVDTLPLRKQKSMGESIVEGISRSGHKTGREKRS